jgi:hypothetical protein
MKTIKSIIFIALVISSYALSVRRVEKSAAKKAKTGAKTKDDGSGTWADGYNCPGFLVVTGSTAFNDDQRKGKGKFFAAKLETPVTAEEKLGWTFDMTAQAPSDPLTKIMVKIGTTNNYYIPFRWLSSDFSYTNPSGYKYLEGWVTNDSKEVFHLRVLLPYKTISWYINDDEGKKIAGLLNTKRNEHKNIVDAKKSGANTAANAYISNKPLFDASSGSATALKAEQDKQKAQVVTLTTDQATKQATYDTNQAKITDLESQLQTLKAAQNDLNASITSISNQIATINANIAASDGGAAASVLVTRYQTALSQAQTDLTKYLGELKAEATIRATDIDAAQTAALALNKVTFTSSLNKVFP